MERDYDHEESGFVRKLLRFRPALWKRIDAYQRERFIKRDSEAIFTLLDKALTAEGFPPAPGDGSKGRGPGKP